MKTKSEQIAQMVLDNVLQWTRGGGNYIHAEKDIVEIADKVLKEKEPKTCKWTLDDDGVYHTGCGEMWQSESGSRSDNGVRYCQRCGRRVSGAK